MMQQLQIQNGNVTVLNVALLPSIVATAAGM
jgi:hypothetical protein